MGFCFRTLKRRGRLSWVALRAGCRAHEYKPKSERYHPEW